MNFRLAIFVFAFVGASPLCLAQEAQVASSSERVSDVTYKTGSYIERAPISSLIGGERGQLLADLFEPDHEIEFDVYAPENYDRSSPAGLIVFVSPIGSGDIPAAWKQVFDRRNLIWVSVNASGNTMPKERRILEATASAAFIARQYEIDRQRLYISGMSGGAQISNIAASLYPGLFRGGIFLCGVDPWSEREPHPWLESQPANFDQIKDNRYVFLSGTEDFKLAATASVYRAYKKSGVENSRLIVIQGMAHELPEAEYYDEAIGFLDEDS